MARNKHDLDGNDKKHKKSLTKILGVIGRRGAISVADMEGDPNLGGRYVYPLLKELCPEDNIILAERLFCWDNLVSCPRKTEKKFKEKIEKILSGKHNITVSSSDRKEIANGKYQTQLWIKQEKNWVKFQIEYNLVKEKECEREKPNFDDDSFKVIRFNGTRERSFDYTFSLYRKSGMLYVYSTDYSNRDVRTSVNKILDRSKEEEIKQWVIEITKYIKENPEVVSDTNNAKAMLRSYGIDPNTCLTDSSKALLEKAGLQIQPRKTIQETFGPKVTSQIEGILRSAELKETRSEKVSRILKSIIPNVVRSELDKLKLKPRYWLYQLNARGLMEYCAITESESEINKVIENLYRDPKYRYYQYRHRFRSEDGDYYIQAFFESYRDVKFRKEDHRGDVIREEIMSAEQFWAMIEREGWIEEENKNENLGERDVKESLKVDDLDFPFLLYHNEMIKAKLLPENFLASELKQITKRLEGLIYGVSLSELIFLVTHHYYKDFEYFMNIKHNIGEKSRAEEIRSKDPKLFGLIMEYQTTLRRYIETVKESEFQSAKSMSSILKIQQEELPKPSVNGIF